MIGFPCGFRLIRPKLSCSAACHSRFGPIHCQAISRVFRFFGSTRNFRDEGPQRIVPVERDFGLKTKIEVGFPTRHSVGQLTNHLLFWNRRELTKFKGEPEEKFSGNNDETFNNFDTKKWNATVKQLDQLMVELENRVETADDKKLQTWASEIAHIGTHNAYHVGQMIFVRKLQGSWNPDKGVK